MNPKITCFYCLYWKSSKAAYLQSNNNKEKKKKGKRRKKSIEKICKINGRDITSETTCCKYYKPANYFYCYRSNCWLKFEQCLNRVKQKRHYFDKKGKKQYFYPECINCYQFDKEVEPVCTAFGITSPKKREVMRRKKVRIKKKVRIISRRRRVNPKKKIKRREKKRTIKRRA